MKVLFTSFGITEERVSFEKGLPLFYRMPPVRSTLQEGKFVPDYAALLLCEKIVMDEMAFDIISHHSHFSFHTMSQTLQDLYREGFIKLVNFDEILSRKQDLHRAMTQQDLLSVNVWFTCTPNSYSIYYIR